MLPSAGPQYRDVASLQKVGALATKGADKLAKGATIARNVQQKVKTKELGKIRAVVRERKSSYEASQAKQKESLNARRDATSDAGKTANTKLAAEQQSNKATQAKQPETREYVKSKLKTVDTNKRVREKTERITAGYQQAGRALSAAQQNSSFGKARQHELNQKMQRGN